MKRARLLQSLVFLFKTDSKRRTLKLMSQAAACDGILYQMMPEGNETLPAPGVLPI